MASTLQLQSGRTAGYGLTTAPLISTSSRLLKSPLNEDVYSQLCQAVIDKLGNNATTFIGGLDI